MLQESSSWPLVLQLGKIFNETPAERDRRFKNSKLPISPSGPLPNLQMVIDTSYLRFKKIATKY